MKCTRQRCQVALRTLAAAALMPSWLSLMTSLTPRRPRRFRLRRNSVQNGSASRAPDLQAEHLALALGVHAHRHYHRHADDAPGLARLDVGGVDPQVRPVAFDLAVQERADALVELAAQTRLTWLLETPLMPSALTRSSTERVEMPWT